MTVRQALALKNGDMVKHETYGHILTVVGIERIEAADNSKSYIRVICVNDYGVLIYHSHKQLKIYKKKYKTKG